LELRTQLERAQRLEALGTGASLDCR